MFCLNNHVFATTIYVDINATGSNNGSSWADAFIDLQDAIGLSVFGDEIWVTEGTYKPTTGTSRTANFSVKNGTKIFGGFNGTESILSQRNFALYVTILSGEIGSGTANDNSYIIVDFNSVANQTKLDGFTITGAYNNVNYGGGVNSEDASPTISNCNFSGNFSADGGGAIYHWGSGILTIEDCIFDGNVGNTYGGGALRLYAGTVNISNSYFKSNQSSASGGAIYIYNSVVSISNSVFAGNIAQNTGSAVRVGDLGTLHLSNSLVVGNYASQVGAVYSSTASNSSAHSIKNCTIAHNKQANSGGASYPSAVALNNEATVTNSIIYGNSNSIQVLGTGITFNYCITQTATSSASGTNIQYTNPQFVLPGDVNNAPFDTVGLNYHLNILSEGIDVGLNANVSGSFDLDGNARIYNSTVDIGAYEEVFCISTSQFTTNAHYTICSGTPVSLTVTDGAQHLWSTGSTANSINVSTAGIYSVIFEDISGCRGVLSASVGTSSNPIPDIIYSGGNLSAGTFSTYQWYFNGNVISGATNSTHVPIQGYGLYQVDVTNTGGCAGTDSYCLSPAELNADGPTTFCSGDNVTLTVVNGDSYVWSTGSLSSSITVTSSGTYSVTVLSTVAGCTVNLQQIVAVNPNPNPSVNFAGGLLSTTSFTTYQWNFNGNPIAGETSQSLDPTATGNGQYSVTVTNSYGCTATSGIFNLTNLSIPEEDLTFVEYFPNPVLSGSVLTILIKEFDQSENHIGIFNSIGEKIMDFKTYGFENRISLENLEKGLYFISVENKKVNISGLKLNVM